MNAFLPGRVFNVSGEVTNDRINCESQHRPTYGRPEQSWPRIYRQADTPNNENGHREPLNHLEHIEKEEIEENSGGRLGPSSKSKGSENQDSQHQTEDAPLTPLIHNFTIHQRI